MPGIYEGDTGGMVPHEQLGRVAQLIGEELEASMEESRATMNPIEAESWQDRLRGQMLPAELRLANAPESP